jgi:CheY-like chemotaxis protein
MINTVFCVDDDPITLMLCEKMFTKTTFCHKTIKLQNGELVFKYLKKNLSQNTENQIIPDLIFLDLNMPIIDGWEFLKIFEREYKIVFPNIKIVILSSSLNPFDKEIIEKYPQIIKFISKPLTVESINLLKKSNPLLHFFKTNGI